MLKFYFKVWRGGGGVDKMLKFYFKGLKVIGKALSGELSCMRTGLVISCCYFHFLILATSHH